MTASRLGVVPSAFVIEHLPASTFPEDDEWIALIRAPEGLTVVREAAPWHDSGRWSGFYGADHPLDVPGTLASLLELLAASGIPTFVASTFHADLVLVPERRQQEAADILARTVDRLT